MNHSQARGSQNFFDELRGAVEANPVPAALIGMGALWMLMGGGRTTAAAALFSSGAARVTDALGPVGKAVKSGASSVGGTLSEFASAAKDSAGQAVEAAGQMAGDAAFHLTSTAADAGSKLQEQSGSAGKSASAMAGTVQGNLAETFERQPLLVGLIGLAIGAAIATGVPKTRVEDEMIGPYAGAVKEKAETFVSEHADKLGDAANRTIEAVKQEAQTQGLTPSALKESVATIRDKAVSAAGAVRRNR